MDKYQNKYRTQSIRANGHRYDGGVYFVTICTKNMEHYFGEIKLCDNCRDAKFCVSTGELSDDEKWGGITGNNNPITQKYLGTVIRELETRITHAANKNNIIYLTNPPSKAPSWSCSRRKDERLINRNL